MKMKPAVRAPAIAPTVLAAYNIERSRASASRLLATTRTAIGNSAPSTIVTGNSSDAATSACRQSTDRYGIAAVVPIASAIVTGRPPIRQSATADIRPNSGDEQPEPGARRHERAPVSRAPTHDPRPRPVMNVVNIKPNA